MANEFIARKGLIVLSNGANVTGSLNVQGDINAGGYSVNATSFTGSILSTNGIVSSSNQIYLDLITGTTFSNAAFLFPQNLTLGGDLIISGNDIRNNFGHDVITFRGTNNSDVRISTGALDIWSGEIRHIGTTALQLNGQHVDVLGRLRIYGDEVRSSTNQTVFTLSGSTLTTNNQIVSGNITLGSSGQIRITNNTVNTLFGFFDGTNILGSYYQMFGNNYSNVTQRGSAEFVFDTQNGGGSGFNVAEFNGSTWTRKFRVSSTGAEVSGSLIVTGGITGSISGSAAAVDYPLTFGDGLTGGSYNGSVAVTTTLDTGSVHFTDGVKKKLNIENVFSSSIQTDVRNTTGIETIATTGSNTFTGVQTISNTTNSTLPSDGALVVHGGVGIEKDVHISGSLTVVGLLTVASMSTQYVTSSQLNVADNKITVQTNDLVRFGGLSVYDSGSTNATASIYWDSENHKFLYENLSGSGYNSAIFIAGPRNSGTLGNEVGLVDHRVPVAHGDDHIDSRIESSSIRIDFPSRLTHIEAGLLVTGSVTSSVGFSGDGSNLTGIVTNLNITGSQGGTGTVSLKTQSLTVTGVNGIATTVSGQTLTVSGSNATTSARGVAAFTSSNFSVDGGMVSANPITFNGVPLNLGSSYAFGLQNITPQGASTSDQLTLSGGAIISNVLYSSATVSNIVGPVTNQVIANIPTGSHDAARFEYVVKDGTNFRTGTVMAVWNGGLVEHTDTSTNDIGNTAQAVFDVDTTVGGNVRLKLNLTSGTWTTKTAVMLI